VGPSFLGTPLDRTVDIVSPLGDLGDRWAPVFVSSTSTFSKFDQQLLKDKITKIKVMLADSS
jgi:hypothetical protein